MARLFASNKIDYCEKKFNKNINSLSNEEIKFLIQECGYVGFYLNYDLSGDNADETRSEITEKLKKLAGTKYKRIDIGRDYDQTSGIILSNNFELTENCIRRIITNKATKDSLSKLIIVALLDNNWIIDTFK